MIDLFYIFALTYGFISLIYYVVVLLMQKIDSKHIEKINKLLCIFDKPWKTTKFFIDPLAIPTIIFLILVGFHDILANSSNFSIPYDEKASLQIKDGLLIFTNLINAFGAMVFGLGIITISFLNPQFISRVGKKVNDPGMTLLAPFTRAMVAYILSTFLAFASQMQVVEFQKAISINIVTFLSVIFVNYFILCCLSIVYCIIKWGSEYINFVHSKNSLPQPSTKCRIEE